jgi:PhzF family phenazine biosynthesis protein
MQNQLYQVDAFTSKVFSGNPAAVCPLESWLDDNKMQSIATENNLSETAFFVRGDNDYEIRWFTPVAEVDLCGHATLASGYIIFNYLEPAADEIVFQSKSGPLFVSRSKKMIHLDFPSQPPKPCTTPKNLIKGLGIQPDEILESEDFVAIFTKEEMIHELRPDMNLLKSIGLRGVITTALAEDSTVDFVSRCFFPQYGIDEDPVTGSAHCALTPYWTSRLGKTTLKARQISKRGGELLCQLKGDRVDISGNAVLYLAGEIHF